MKCDDILLRQPDILGRPATAHRPATVPLIPVSKTTWWAGVKSGRFPAPVRLGPRCVAWRASDIRRLIDQRTSTGTGGGA